MLGNMFRFEGNSRVKISGVSGIGRMIRRMPLSKGEVLIFEEHGPLKLVQSIY